MEILNLKEHSPEEYPGKIININSQEYIIGHLVGQGGHKLVYQLINSKSGLCHYVLSIPLNQNLAAGNNKFGPYSGMNCYDYYRNIAKMTFHYEGYSDEKKLPIFADFLDIKDFSYIENEYKGIFVIAEFLNDAGDDNTGGIYQKDLNDFLILTKIYLRKNSRNLQDMHYLCELCLEYLKKVNQNDDNIMEIYILTKMRLLDGNNQKDRDEILNFTRKMIDVEPYFKRHIYTAVLVYFNLSKWDELVSLFENIKEIIYEPYSDEWFMERVVFAYKKLNKIKYANKYLKYIRPNRRKIIMED